MTAPPRLIDSSGRAFPLDRQLASGGEGAVYLLPNDPAQVAKVYHKPPSPQTVEKLIAMVGLLNHELLKVAAWPSALLFTTGPRQVAGFVMPRLTDYHPIQHLYNPVMRLKHFPNAGWSFQVRAALNASAAFDEVHKSGCLVGDVNQSNAQVSQQALVRLIDCDSFQVRTSSKQYLCEVGVPHYTPPELQGKSFRGLVRTENHDRFGLAVFIYQLLFVGRHPYAGVFRGSGDPSFEELISQYRFAQGPQAHSWQMGPPPHTPTFADIPPDLGILFRRAFERGSENANRPRPSEWMASLKDLEKNTAECLVDPGHKYWRGQAKCVWCRLAEGGGPEYYIGAGGHSAGFAVDEKKLQEVMRRLAEFAEPPTAPTRANYQRGVVVAGRPLTEQAARLRAAWDSATTAANQIINARRAEEAREIRLAEANEARLLAEVDNEFDAAEQEWDEEYAEARAVLAERWKDRQRVTIILASVAALGVVAVCAGVFIHRILAITGGIATAVFGVWLLVHFALLSFGAPSRHLTELRANWKRIKREFADRREELSDHTAECRRFARAKTDEVMQSQQARVALIERAYFDHVATERQRREERFQDCERVVADLERTLKMRADGAIGRHRQARAELTALVALWRNLAAEYQTELRRVVASTEANARTRHLRMHLLTDAEIEDIGAGRKQTLMANGISTAADVSWDAVIGIYRFGEKLTQRLVDWRTSVERSFSFNPTAATNSSEHRALVQQFRTRQNQYQSDMNRLLGELVVQQSPDFSAQQAALRLAVAEWDQANADLRVLTTRG